MLIRNPQCFLTQSKTELQKVGQFFQILKVSSFLNVIIEDFHWKTRWLHSLFCRDAKASTNFLLDFHHNNTTHSVPSYTNRDKLFSQLLSSLQLEFHFICKRSNGVHVSVICIWPFNFLGDYFVTRVYRPLILIHDVIPLLFSLDTHQIVTSIETRCHLLLN